MLCVALTATLAACSTPPPPTAELDEAPLSPRSAPPPPGSILDGAGIAPEETFNVSSDGWPGSLRPGTEADRDGVHTRRIKERGRIIVGVDQSQYLLSSRDQSRGQLRGFEIDLAHEIAQDIFGDPTKVDFRFVNSASRTSSLRSGTVDVVVLTMSVTPKRAAEVDFSTPYMTSDVRMLAPKDRGIDGIDDLAGRTVCIVDGTNLLDLVREKMPESKILRTRSWSDCLMATQQYQADAVVGDDAVLAGMVAQDPLTKVFPEQLARQVYAVAAPRGHDDLVRQVNSTIERLRGSESWDRMYQQWFAGSLINPELPAPMYREDS